MHITHSLKDGEVGLLGGNSGEEEVIELKPLFKGLKQVPVLKLPKTLHLKFMDFVK